MCLAFSVVLGRKVGLQQAGQLLLEVESQGSVLVFKTRLVCEISWWRW